MANSYYHITLTKRRTHKLDTTNGAIPYDTVRVLLCHYHVTDNGTLHCQRIFEDGCTRHVLTLPPGSWDLITLEGSELEPVFPEHLK